MRSNLTQRRSQERQEPQSRIHSCRILEAHIQSFRCSSRAPFAQRSKAQHHATKLLRNHSTIALQGLEILGLVVFLGFRLVGLVAVRRVAHHLVGLLLVELRLEIPALVALLGRLLVAIRSGLPATRSSRFVAVRPGKSCLGRRQIGSCLFGSLGRPVLALVAVRLERCLGQHQIGSCPFGSLGRPVLALVEESCLEQHQIGSCPFVDHSVLARYLGLGLADVDLAEGSCLDLADFVLGLVARSCLVLPVGEERYLEDLVVAEEVALVAEGGSCLGLAGSAALVVPNLDLAASGPKFAESLLVATG